jgi:TolA-binding protein
MKAQSKQRLEEYKNNNLQNTEGVEQSIIREATRMKDRDKWASMLSEDGIKRTDKVVSSEKKEEIKPTIIRRLAPYVLGLAAAVTILIMVMSPSGSSFDDMILKNPKDAVEVRMGQNEDVAAWKKAIEAYRNKQYETAAESIKLIAQPTSEQKFYLALSLIYQSNPDFTLSSFIFKDLADKHDAFFEEEARWFLAYCQFKLGQKAEAKTTLENIVKTKKYNHAKAETILKNELK